MCKRVFSPVVALLLTACANGHQSEPQTSVSKLERGRPLLKASFTHSDGAYAPGTTVVNSKQRTVFHYGRDGFTYGFPIAIGRDGFGWYGEVRVCGPKSGRVGVEYNPRWFPTERMVREDSAKPAGKRLGLAQYQATGMPPGGRNPFGSVAIRLCHPVTGQYLQYNLHGTARNDRHTVGYAASSGCFRMFNEQALKLAELVRPGDRVIVLQARIADTLIGG